MAKDQGASADADRATRASPQAASHLGHAASIASAWRRFSSWLSPVATAIFGMGALMVAVGDREGPHIVLGVIGGLLILSALESAAGAAQRREKERWAELIADMIAGERSLSITVSHTWDSMRPHIDERLAELVNAALSRTKGEAA